MQTLLNEIIKHIFSFLSSKQRSLICSVCITWEKLTLGFVPAQPYESYHAFVRSKQHVDLVAACKYADIDLVMQSYSLTPTSSIPEQVRKAVQNTFIHGDTTVIGYILGIADDVMTHEAMTDGRLNHYYIGFCISDAFTGAITHDQISVLEYLRHAQFGERVMQEIKFALNDQSQYEKACVSCKVSTLEYLERGYTEKITDDVLSNGLDNACDTTRGNMEVIKYLLPRVPNLSSAYFNACSGENIEVINYLNQYSSRINYDECYRWCEDFYFDSGTAEIIIKYAMRPISQYIIQRSFTRACSSGDYAAMLIMDWLDDATANTNANIIVEGFYNMCKTGQHNMEEMCSKHKFTLEQLLIGRLIMPKIHPDMWKPRRVQITRARNGLDRIIAAAVSQ